MTDTAVRLTRRSTCGGCAAKLDATELRAAVATIPVSTDPRLLVGPATFDDAAAYRIADDLVLIQTVDFFPAMVDDPYTFGAIAAANALSDVYAMGGQPLTAMNIVAFPSGELPPHVLTELLRGGAEKVSEAGAAVVGGHTITDRELKFGLAVTGRAHPDFLLTNAAALPGDRVVLTKPLGTGVATTAARADDFPADALEAAISSMLLLNGPAARAALAAGARCATDITGFGLLGHAAQVADASGATLRIDARCIPRLPGTEHAIAAGHVTGGGARNAAYLADRVEWGTADDITRALLLDPQTSGGLLVTLPPERAARFVARVPGAVDIGDVVARGERAIVVT